MEENLIHILLVEDDLVDQMNVKRAFTKNNIHNPLVIANNGQEALDMLKGNGCQRLNPIPKIILLDINMPKMNGIEFLTHLRKDEELKSTTVFIMTTSNEDCDRFNAYNLNVAGYILKPLNFEKFVSAVATLNNYWKLIELP